VKSSWNGFVVPRGDAAAIEAALRKVIVDDALRAQLGVNARALSGEHIDSRRAFASYLSLYGDLVARPRASRDQNRV
jgi:hypothetical protein